jgi:hypothetical protein
MTRYPDQRRWRYAPVSFTTRIQMVLFVCCILLPCRLHYALSAVLSRPALDLDYHFPNDTPCSAFRVRMAVNGVNGERY